MSDAPQLRKIKTVEALSGYRLNVTWDRGSKTTVDLSEMVHRGGVFAPLSDKNVFAAVRVGENNRVVEWPSPKDDLGYPVIEIDAESLIAKASEQVSHKLVRAMRNAIDSVRPIRRLQPTSTKF